MIGALARLREVGPQWLSERRALAYDTPLRASLLRVLTRPKRTSRPWEIR
ncbi:hypothetical protein WMF31_14810 [Sorangium sp. So ce1036]